MTFPYQRPVPGIAWIMACAAQQHHAEVAGEPVDIPVIVVQVDILAAAEAAGVADTLEIVVQVDISAAVEHQSVVELVAQTALHIASHSIPFALAGSAEAEVAVVLRFPLFSLYCYTFKTFIAACNRRYSHFSNNTAHGFALSSIP